MTAPNGPIGDPQPGDRIGRYRLVSVLGTGGSGTVFLAVRDEADQGRVAIKILHPFAARDAVLARRFGHEARVAASLRHSGLVPLLESGEVEGRGFLVSRYMAGGSLAARLDRDGPLPIADGVRLIRQVAGGIDALHAAGIVHRDVKPANILLEPDGTAAIGDLGLARGGGDTVLTRPGQVLGTMEYIAPELIQGKPATPASDVYALGCVAYAAFVGASPFAGRGPLRTAFAHLEEAPADPATRRPEVGPGLSRAILEALAKTPDDRPAGAIAYAAGLERAADS